VVREQSNQASSLAPPPLLFAFPIQHDGASTVVLGLYFMGTHFLRKRKSSTLFGMGEDAKIVARTIADRMQ
jgi:putative flavoprotein involved in K+ transport